MDKTKLLTVFIPNVIYSLVWLSVAWFWFRRRSAFHNIVKGNIFLFFIIGIYQLASLNLIEYSFIHSHKSLRFFLPPYSNYFFERVTKSVSAFIISLIISFAIFCILFVYAKKTRQEVIDIYDVTLLTLGMFIIGWPEFLIFLFFVFAFTVLGSIIMMVIKKGQWQGRFIITPYIPIAFLIALWFSDRIAEFIMLDRIRF